MKLFLVHFYSILVVGLRLIILSLIGAFKKLRTAGAVLVGTAAIAWIAERLSQQPNPVTVFISIVAGHGIALIIALFILSMIFNLIRTKNELKSNKVNKYL